MKTDVFKSKNMLRGEMRMKGVVVTTDSGATPASVTDPTFQVFTEKDVAVTQPETAFVDGNKVYAIVPAGSQKGNFYTELTYTVNGTYTCKARLTYSVE